MLGISRQTDYGIRVVLHLACLEPGARVTLAEISERRLLPTAFVRRLVSRLVAGGILKTTRGAGGGVRLAIPASDISLLDVVRAMEGPLALNECATAPQTCPLAEECPVQRVWTRGTALVEEYLAGIRFDTLATGAEGHVTAHDVPKKPKTSARPTKRRVPWMS